MFDGIFCYDCYYNAATMKIEKKRKPKLNIANSCEKPTTKMREFVGGAIRDSVEGKYDYEGFFSPLVIEAYGEYMHKHRKQADGKMRDSDNWQKGFGDDHYGVCMKSAWRHFIDMWKERRGMKTKDGLKAAIMGVLFNVMAYAHKYLKEEADEPGK